MNIEDQGKLIRSIVEAIRQPIRQIRQRPVEVSVRCSDYLGFILLNWGSELRALCPISFASVGETAVVPDAYLFCVVDGMEVFLHTDQKDIAAERERHQREYGRCLKLIAAKERTLANAQFIEKAPSAVVARERAALEQLQNEAAQHKAQIC
jgi:valyl-tRNA synthetase